MSITLQSPMSTVADDPDAPGTYLTDGERLFRLLGDGETRHGYLAIEDCMTLDVVLVDGRDLSDCLLLRVEATPRAVELR